MPAKETSLGSSSILNGIEVSTENQANIFNQYQGIIIKQCSIRAWSRWYFVIKHLQMPLI